VRLKAGGEHRNVSQSPRLEAVSKWRNLFL
jgi:hypothetical protein